MMRPSGSVLKSRVSMLSVGCTRREWIRPVFVSKTKSESTPRICPSSVLTAAYPLQTEDRKPNWVSHGNEKAFKRARGAIENLDVGYAVLGGFHSHTGDDGAASLSSTDLDYVTDELRRLSRDRPEERVQWLEVVMALKRRAWSRQHEIGWTARQYRRKLGCSVALDASHGYDMTIGGFWVEGEPDGVPGSWDVVGTREARLLLPWNQ